MKRLWLWAPVAAQMLAIFVASSMHDVPALPGDVSDKTAHSVGYAILAALLVRALAGGRALNITLRVAVLSIVLATAYGATDEFHQRFVYGRTSDVLDLAADARGATLAALGLYAILRIPAIHQRLQ